MVKLEALIGKKALVIDHNSSNLEILAHLLELADMRVISKGQPIDALPVILESFNGGDPVDICVVDIETSMLNGFDLAKQVHQLPPPLSKLPLLAYYSPVVGRSGRYKGSGFDGFLPKPIRRKKLVQLVERLLTKVHSLDENVDTVDNREINPGDILLKWQEPQEPSELQEVSPQQKQNVQSELQNQELINFIANPFITGEAGHSIHILLVEDNPINRKLASFILGKAGYRLSVVENGEKAVEVFTAAPEKFDLVFMDIQMPRMNGLEATRILRERGFKDIPIIAMTAQSMKGDKEKFLAAGMNDYIAKPIKRELVFAMVEKWCLHKN